MKKILMVIALLAGSFSAAHAEVEISARASCSVRMYPYVNSIVSRECIKKVVSAVEKKLKTDVGGGNVTAMHTLFASQSALALLVGAMNGSMFHDYLVTLDNECHVRSIIKTNDNGHYYTYFPLERLEHLLQ